MTSVTLFSCRILADSITEHGERLTTIHVTYPRVVHAEACRHRVHCRCAASSRAIPVSVFLERVRENPYIPIEFGKNKRGMSADELLDPEETESAMAEWLEARDDAVRHAEKLAAIGAHKQVTNRLLEPFQLMSEAITATEWSNFDHLRNHPRASPEMQRLARMVRSYLDGSTPVPCSVSPWHLPAVTEEERSSIRDWRTLARLSAGRIARGTYDRIMDTGDLERDLERSAGLLSDGHCSPFEHQARPQTRLERMVYELHTVQLANGTVYDMRGVPPRVGDVWWDEGDWSGVTHVRTTHFCGPFDGWMQHRKMIPREWDRLAP